MKGEQEHWEKVSCQPACWVVLVTYLSFHDWPSEDIAWNSASALNLAGFWACIDEDRHAEVNHCSTSGKHFPLANVEMRQPQYIDLREFAHGVFSSIREQHKAIPYVRN